MINSFSHRKVWEDTSYRVMQLVDTLAHEYQVYKANPSQKTAKRLIRSVRNSQRNLGEIAGTMKKGVEPKRAKKAVAGKKASSLQSKAKKMKSEGEPILKAVNSKANGKEGNALRPEP